MTWAHFSTFRWISRDFQWFLASQFFPRDRFWKKSQWHERAHRERHFKPIFFGGVNKSLLVRGKNRYLCTFGTKLAPSKSRWASRKLSASALESWSSCEGILCTRFKMCECGSSPSSGRGNKGAGCSVSRSWCALVLEPGRPRLSPLHLFFLG